MKEKNKNKITLTLKYDQIKIISQGLYLYYEELSRGIHKDHWKTHLCISDRGIKITEEIIKMQKMMGAKTGLKNRYGYDTLT